MHRLVLTAALVASSLSAAQVTVTGKDGKSVKVGAGGVEVKKGDSSVSVSTGSTGVDVRSGRSDGSGSTVVVGADDRSGLGPPSGLVKGVWQVRGMSKQERHECAPNEDVDVAGQSNVLTFTGPCRSVRISGQSNVVTLEEVASLQVSGMSNAVTWTRGAGGAAPKVKVSGLGNSASPAK